MTVMAANDAVLAHLPVLALHILGGIVGILTGWGAVLVAKGGRRHRLFGKAFVAGMALLGVAAIWLASQLVFFKPMEQMNVAVAFLVLYLIFTAWMTVRRPPGTVGTFEKSTLALAVALSATFFLWGARATASGGHDGYAAPIYFVFGSVTALFAAFDVRVIWRGGISGSARIARHLTRMCTAWFIASISFFLGQQKIMPEWMHGSIVLTALAFAPLAFMLFWLVRVRIRFKRAALVA
ncbi:MAG: hypothetical protein WBQ17_08685 [Rhizomicrobium sp.]